uniref:PiggyBac transposable element-derived protein domain-containing protein n=1 Tax=Glossina palpalis gambiensis TaxID=67801 RepID=A0A1B0AXK3_9MUSC
MNGLLFEGRTLYKDSYYTRVPLAEELLDKLTNLCGTVKVNRGFVQVVAKLKQKRVSVENPKGVKFLKWTDKRSVCMLTTCNNRTCTIIEGTKGKLKPDAIFDYNNAKKGVDISDQIASYYNSLRKTIK